MILARPQWRDWLIFTAGELVYFVAIWWHLGGLLTPGDSSADRIYWLAVLIRLSTQSWVAIMVVRDALRPEFDPVRAGGRDDPTGGVLDGAPDAGLAARSARAAAAPGQEDPCWFGRLRSGRQPASTRRRRTAAGSWSRRGSPAAG